MKPDDRHKLGLNYILATMAYNESQDRLKKVLETGRQSAIATDQDPIEISKLTTPKLFNDHMKKLGEYINAYYNYHVDKPEVQRGIAVTCARESKTAAILGLDAESEKLMGFVRYYMIKNTLAAHHKYRQNPGKEELQAFVVAMKEIMIIGAEDAPEIAKILPDFNQALETLIPGKA